MDGGGEMKIWVVGVADCEGSSMVAICTTKEIAERELFKIRDTLVAEWKECIFSNEEWGKDMYKGMVKALEGDDYQKWNNYPHDCPHLYEAELLDK
jgi:hypothetical protein